METLWLGLDLPRIPLGRILKDAVRSGKRFFSVTEVMRMLGVKRDRIDDAVHQCTLDAFFFGGEYRIPWTAVATLEDDQLRLRRFRLTYWSWMRQREVPCFFKVRELAAEGASMKDLHKLLARHGADFDDGTVRAMAGRELPDTAIPDDPEADPQDWYDIPSMGLPFSASAFAWSALLRTSCNVLGVDPDAVIGYPDIFDFLVAHEMANLPVPMGRTAAVSDSQDDDDGQLLLFGGA